MSIDLSNPATAFLLIYWSAGLVLLVMRMLDGRAGAPSFLKALLLLLIPSVGWGVWRHDVRQARSDGPHAPAAVPILGSMGTLHAIVLGLETILVATLWSGVGRDLLVDVGEHDVGPEVHEMPGDGKADPLGRAGDNGGLSGDGKGHVLPCS